MIYVVHSRLTYQELQSLGAPAPPAGWPLDGFAVHQVADRQVRYDPESQAVIAVDEEANAATLVDTPDGPMALPAALRERAGAFCVSAAGALLHDETWAEFTLPPAAAKEGE